MHDLHYHSRWARFELCILALAFLAALPARSANVLTQHNDAARTGANLEETQLTPAKVSSGFGKLFARHVDGQIYAQPLVVSGIEMPGKGVHNVVYVATMENNVYAFDADDADEERYFWKINLGQPVPHAHIPEALVAAITGYNIKPSIGITSTPVIDPATKRMWVVAKTFESPDIKHYHLVCLDITTGQQLGSSPEIQATEDKAVLQADTALQRPGLLLANGTIYLAFGSHQDGGDYNGWVVAFDSSTLAKKYAFCTTPGKDSGMGGIWQSGNGPAADADGNLYVMVGNGLFDAANHQYGTSFVKLSPELKVLDSFTPWNYKKLTDQDLDLGSAGPMLLPGSDQLVGGGKEGWLFLLARNQMGHLQPKHSTAPALQRFKVSDHWSLTWFSWLFPVFGYHHIHGSPVYWQSSQLGPVVYVWPEQTHLKAFRYDPVTHFQVKPAATGPKAPKGMPGGFLSISANGDHDGILWATSPLAKDALIETVPGVLRAFDAITLQQLWSSATNAPEDVFNFAKDCPPTVANGKVYLATFSDRLNVYGLVRPEPPLTEREKAAKPPEKGSSRSTTGRTP
jgi:outer membrane protein assembly factor BamB